MDAFVQYLTEYRYVALLLAALIEGPIASFVAGSLVAMGKLDFFAALGVLLFKDIVLDGVFYWIGRLARWFGSFSSIAKNMRLSTGFTDRLLQKVEQGWWDHPVWLMWVSKLAYGLSAGFLVTAGMAKIRFSYFYVYAIPVTLFQYGVLMTLGYFFGNSIYSIIPNALVVVACVAVGSVVVFFAFRFFAQRIRSRYVETQNN